MPPEWMWHLGEELEEWFEEVDWRRKEKYGTGDGGVQSKDSLPDDSLMVQNEFARGRR